MDKKQARALFAKYVNKQCTPQEIELLHNYLDSYQDKNRLWAELKYDEELKGALWAKIRQNVQPQVSNKRIGLKRYIRYAAIFLGLVASVLFYQYYISREKDSEVLITDTPILIKRGNTITEIDTSREELIKDEAGKVLGRQKGGQISYESQPQITELVYNEIFVPKGKKFQLVLSDGTKVYINAETSLKYPVNFLPEKSRKVFLKGEAYFEVARNKKVPFTVNTEEMEVKVLGTQFNVSSYEETLPFMVLKEGSVAIRNTISPENKENSIVIKPGEKAEVNNESITVSEVDVDDYLGWTTGKLNFNDQSFNDIVQKIERHYGVVIVNEFPALGQMRFRGVFTDESVTDFMDTFKESASFEYKIEGRKIVIIEPK